MTTRWSSEYVVAEHRDVQASAMAVDSTGSFALLGGRKWLALKNLDKPAESLIKFPRQSKFDVGVAEWNPHSQHKELCAISCGEKVEIVNMNTSNLSLTHSLTSHTRVVNDVNWHQFNPHLLASCSIDRFTYIWDLRDIRRPALLFSAIVGAYQVKWSHYDSFVLATSHNGDVKLWDQRRGTAPVSYISAHEGNIHCIDWSPNEEHKLATSGQDCTVKFFDTVTLKQEHVIISSVAPIWRARYTPFGNGLLVVVTPRRRGDNSLLLWHLSSPSTPLHTFLGHSDIVLEFAWRLCYTESSNYQLITWSKDQTLRLWQIDSYLETMQNVGTIEENTANAEESEGSLAANESNTYDGELSHVVEAEEMMASVETDLTESSASGELAPARQPLHQDLLSQEFSQAHFNIPHLTIEPMDVIERYCVVSLYINEFMVCLNISFPPDYPHNSAPTFEFTSETSIDKLFQDKLLKLMKHIALQRVRKRRTCLEQCVKQLVSTVEQLVHIEEQDKGALLRAEADLINKHFHDSFIPFPRLSGAHFSSTGYLVCFGRKMNTRSVESVTPRSLSALATIPPESPFSMSSFYFHERQTSERGRTSRILSRQKLSKATVNIFDVSCLLPVQKDLAEKYVFESEDVVGMCLKNGGVASSVGRKDLEEVWCLAALAATPPPRQQHQDVPWCSHPLALGIIYSMIDYYASHYDVQTAAMLCCAFGTKTSLPKESGYKVSSNKSLSPEPVGSSRHTIHQMEGALGGWKMSSRKLARSNSWSDIYEESAKIVEHTPFKEPPSRLEPGRIRLEHCDLYDMYKLEYAKMLESWQLLHARAQVMKYVSSMPSGHKGLVRATECPTCFTQSMTATCDTCRKPLLRCVICTTPVRGLASSCVACLHGGHMRHIEKWFLEHSVCPTGCGCHCILQESQSHQ